MVERKEYLDELIGWKDEQVIKVVTGIRRCGKSTLLMQYQAWLRENGGARVFCPHPMFILCNRQVCQWK